MATPRADSYTAASGGGIYGGRQGPPAWLSAMTVGVWGQIPGTSGPWSGLKTGAFSDMTIRPSDSTLLVVAAGGHNDGHSNAAAALKLTDSAPAWTTLRESTWNGVESNVAYYADGSPASRHTYHHTHYIESIDAVLLAGCRYGWGGGTPLGAGMDLFSLTSNNYLPRYTWPDISPDLGSAGYGVAQDGEGNIWTINGYKFNVATKTWSRPGTGSLGRYPNAYDSIRNKLVCLVWNDGEGYGASGLTCRDFDPTTGNAVNITFNPSPGYSQYQADAPQYAGMAFCPLNGKLYLMHNGRPGTFYVVTPNQGTVWDMEAYTPGGSVPASGEPLCKRLLWVPGLNGFALQTLQAANLSFLRMS